jgi:hypothetical protein
MGLTEQHPVGSIRVAANTAWSVHAAGEPVPQQSVAQSAMTHASAGCTTPNSAAATASVAKSRRITYATCAAKSC